MSRVYIAQLLCGPLRHCIVAAAIQTEDYLNERDRSFLLADVTTTLGDLVDRLCIEHRCAVCAAPRPGWCVELAATRFETMADALPHLESEEAKQRLAHEHFKKLRDKAELN